MEPPGHTHSAREKKKISKDVTNIDSMTQIFFLNKIKIKILWHGLIGTHYSSTVPWQL